MKSPQGRGYVNHKRPGGAFVFVETGFGDQVF